MKQTQPHAEIKTVTPIWAKEVITKHQQSLDAKKFAQRPLSERTVSIYAADMIAGNWALTGQGISFDDNDNLLDGQHRLAAVVKANKPVQMMVLSGLPAAVNFRLKTIDTFDIGKKRNLAQQLRIDGFTWYAEVATTARLLILLSMGNVRTVTPTGPQGISVANQMKADIYHIIQILARNNGSKLRGSIIAPLALMHSVDTKLADAFATELNEMTGLTRTSPVLHFSRFMERPVLARSGTEYQQMTMGALSSALYSYAHNQRVEQIRGNKEHLEWLLKICQKPVVNILRICGLNEAQKPQPK
jgi:hypothetical protein